CPGDPANDALGPLQPLGYRLRPIVLIADLVPGFIVGAAAQYGDTSYAKRQTAHCFLQGEGDGDGSSRHIDPPERMGDVTGPQPKGPGGADDDRIPFRVVELRPGAQKVAHDADLQPARVLGALPVVPDEQEI